MYDETVPVIENRALTGGHYLLSLHSPRQASLTQPGQFAMVRLIERANILLRRPMSIYDLKPAAHQAGNGSAGGPEIVQLLYKVVGRGTRLMAELNPGDQVDLLAPLGHGFLKEEYLGGAKSADEILLVAGGIGIAALLLPARDVARAGLRQKLFFGGRTREDLVGVEDFERLVRGTILATENGAAGHRGYVTQPLETYLRGNAQKRFMIMACGPWAMLRATVELARKYNHACIVSMENRMGCGLGVCLGCSIHVDGTGHGTYERVCTEGPVFPAERVIWEREEIPKI